MRIPTILVGGVAAAAAATAVGLTAAHADNPLPLAHTITPVKHVVVIFDENESFDHYFGTYPQAANPAGEPSFTAAPDTPSVNGLNQTLLTDNPNSSPPQRLDRTEAVTCSQNHGYSAEQRAFDRGLMDKFPENTAGSAASCTGPRGQSIVMDYYDGNTVTGLWNLAQHFSLNDNSYSTNFGPSTVGAINLISGQTHGATVQTAGGIENGTVIGDPDPSPTLDDCAAATGTAIMTGKNVGDLLNLHNVSWGFFEGGFKPTGTVGTKAVCGASHANVANASTADYIPHHQPFEYYASTANPHHKPPSSVAMIGSTDQANHQYDLTDFDAAVAHGNLPSVSFLKAAGFEDGHPGYSDPLDEQHFIARTLNELQQSPDWSSTAVVILYDDSDGWYDHVMSPIVSRSNAQSDALTDVGKCGDVPAGSTAYMDRCGYGPRQPLLVISPFAKQNYVDGTLTDQTSVLKFIEDNWQLGRIGDQSLDQNAGTLLNMFDFDLGARPAPKLFLDPDTGVVVNKPPKDDGGSSPDDAAPDPSPDDVSSDTGDQYRDWGADYTDTKTTVYGKPAKLKLACSTRRAGKKVAVSCTATGSDVGHGTTALRFRLARGAHVYVTGRTTLSKRGTAKITLRPGHALKPGRYTLRIAITRAGGVTGVSQTVRLS